MHIYRLRILNEENDSFVRDMELKPTNTFEEFHKAILQSIGFEEGEMASFYICDSQWRRLQEISLWNLSEDQEVQNQNNEFEDDDEQREDAQKAPPILVMADTRLKDVVNDPHQRFMYIYDFLNMFTFYIELIKIAEGSDKQNYPLCTKSAGNIVRPLKNPVKPDNNSDTEEELLKEYEDMFNEEELPDQDNVFFGDLFEENSFN